MSLTFCHLFILPGNLWLTSWGYKAELPVDDAKLSRRHCRVVRSPEGVVLELQPGSLPL